MKKCFSYNGNGWQLYMPKSVLQVLGYNPDETKVLLTVKEDILYIEKANPDDYEKLKDKMLKPISKRGNGRCIYIPMPVIELIGVVPEKDMIDFIVDGDRIIIKKADL